MKRSATPTRRITISFGKTFEFEGLAYDKIEVDVTEHGDTTARLVSPFKKRKIPVIGVFTTGLDIVASGTVAGLNASLTKCREAHGVLARGIKKVLGLKNWPDLKGRPFAVAAVDLLEKGATRKRSPPKRGASPYRGS